MTSRIRVLAPVLAGLATMASAATPIPAATNSGPAQSCVPLTQIDHTTVRSNSIIDFYMRGDRKVYRNTLPSDCPELGFERAFSYETSLTQLCSVDIITVLHQGEPRIRGASCGLGEFQPVTLAKDGKGGAVN